MKKILLIFFLAIFFNCERKSEDKEWIYLFSDKYSSYWKAYNGDTLPKKWKITNNILTFDTDFYHLKEGFEETSEVAPEYQLLDDDGWEEMNKAKLSPWQKAGADYAMYPPDIEVKKLYPSGEWNSTKIIFTEKKVEYWLNEQKILSFSPWSQDWYERKKNGKWKDSKFYGRFKKGYIGLQDHNSSISFRNMKIRKL